jgi:hypothetical protein
MSGDGKDKMLLISSLNCGNRLINKVLEQLGEKSIEEPQSSGESIGAAGSKEYCGASKQLRKYWSNLVQQVLRSLKAAEKVFHHLGSTED